MERCSLSQTPIRIIELFDDDDFDENASKDLQISENFIDEIIS